MFVMGQGGKKILVEIFLKQREIHCSTSITRQQGQKQPTMYTDSRVKTKVNESCSDSFLALRLQKMP